MTIFVTRVRVAEDGTVTGRVPADVPAGEHSAVITIERSGRQFDVDALPDIDLGPWPKSVELRREDIYSDEGR